MLQSKLYMPPARHGAVRRARLTQQLGGNGAARLILVSAPPGFGKTSVVAEWLTLEGEPLAAWLQLEPADNDLGRFWRYVIAALQRAGPGIGARLEASLNQPGLPPESWLTFLLNDLAGLSHPLTLVLDDYHHIRTPSIHQSLNYLLCHLPPGIRLALISRADPPLPLARLRVQEELIELRASDLRFTEAEMAYFLNEAECLGLSANDIALLERRTEGWPAGVHLAARTLQAYQPVERSEVIQSFSGSHRHILTYLLEEVLHQQEPVVRDFLLQTSILTRLSGPLCAAVTGRTPGETQQLLALLTTENLFLLPLDEQGCYFRYHALFADSLAGRLHSQDFALWTECHRRAGQWCADNGQVECAINHALAAGDYDTAGRLIERVAEKTWTQGELTTLLHWLEALPTAARNSRIVLRLAYIWILFLHERWEEATALWGEAGDALDGLPDPARRRSRGLWATMGAAMAARRQDPETTIRLAQQGLASLAPDDDIWRATNQAHLGLAYMAQGNAGPAASAFRAAADLSLVHENAFVAFASLSHLGHVCLMLGRLNEAESAWRRLRQLEEMPGGRALALRTHGDIGLSEIAYERNELSTAAQLLTGAMEKLWPGGHPRVLILGRTVLAQIRAAAGDWPAAYSELDMAAELARHLRIPGADQMLAAHRARLAQREGRPDMVRIWVEEGGLTPQDLPDFRQELEHIVLAEALIGERRYVLAEGLLARLHAMASRTGRAGSDIHLLALQALALAGLARPAEAETALNRALALAEPQGYVRTFLDLGAPLMELLRSPGVRKQSPAYVGRLLQAFDQGFGPIGANGRTGILAAPEPDGAPALLEELTPRERQILILVARGASNQDIANDLFLSIGTVKGHINHIFSKLGVHNRTAAVAHARYAGLIKP